MSKRRIKVGDLVKYVRKGTDRFPIPRVEGTGVVVELDSMGEPSPGEYVVRVQWLGDVSNHASPPPWISESLLEVLSRG